MMPSAHAMLQIEDLVFAYPEGGQAPVFDGFTWQVNAGESWAVIGPSGCGKSTLLYLIAGLRQPTSGRVLVDGQRVPRPRASTGLILQDYGLLPWATVWENVALVMRIGRFYRGKAGSGLGLRPYPREDITARQVDGWLARLGIENLRDKYPGQISGGQRQRTAIARSLLQQPNLLLMDEPFASLDALTREDLQQLIVDLRRETGVTPPGASARGEALDRREGVTTVIVTHNIEEAVFLGQHILALDHAPNTSAHVIENPEAAHAAYRDQPTYLQKCTELRSALTSR